MSEPPSCNEKAAYPPPADHAPKPTAYPPQNVPPPTEYVNTPQPQQIPEPARQPPQHMQGVTTMIVTQPVNCGTPSMYRMPVLFNCSYCGTQQITKISYRRGTAFWVNCLVYGLLTFCFERVKDVHHTCPNCNNTVGVNKPQVRYCY